MTSHAPNTHEVDLGYSYPANKCAGFKYEGSFSSGAIDEYRTCKDNGIVTAVLYEQGRLATSIQKYAKEYPFIREFPYTFENLETVLKEAAAWAEEFVHQRKTRYEQSLETEKYR